MKISYNSYLILTLLCSAGYGMETDPSYPHLIHTLENKGWDGVRNICYTPDGTQLAQSGDITAFKKSILRLWNAKAFSSYSDIIMSGSTQGGLAITNDNKQIACDFETDAQANVGIWDSATCKLILQLKQQTHNNFLLNFNAAQTLLLVASKYGNGSLWDMRTGNCIKILPCSNPVGGMSSAQWKPYDDTTIVAAQWQKFAKIWDLRSGNFIQTDETPEPLCLMTYNDRGTKLIGVQPGNLVIFDADGKEKGMQPYWPGADSTVKPTALKILPNSDIVLAGMWVGIESVGICDIEFPNNSKQWPVGGPVDALAVTQDGKRVAIKQVLFDKKFGPKFVVKIFDSAALVKTVSDKNKIGQLTSPAPAVPGKMPCLVQ